MKRAWTFLAIAILVVMSSCELMTEDPAADKRMYLMTVALDYEDTSMNALRGAVNDQDAMERQIEFLCTEEGCDYTIISFSARGGRYSRNEVVYSRRIGERIEYHEDIPRTAMKDMIMAELTSLSADITCKDIFMFHYAGHGADSSGDDDRHLNGALVVGDIVFPEIGSWQKEEANQSSLITIAELKMRLAYIDAPRVVMLDSCYSGSLIGQSVGIDRVGDILSSIRSMMYRGSGGNGRYYLFSACRDDEVSYEDSDRGQRHGFFSAALLEALGYRFYDDGIEGPGLPDDPTITTSMLYERMREKGLWEYQSPQMNPYHVDLVLFTL